MKRSVVPAPAPSPKAYSYLRFSTPEQLKGDSLRRQSDASRAYAAKHKLELDEELTFEDRGLSGFRSKNMTDGALGIFLEAVRVGVVAQGSYLLVESLDRISRDKVRQAIRTLENLCDAGIVVVTLMDGKMYDKELLDTDHFALIMVVLHFARAHEESATKQRRLQAAWANKRTLAAEHKEMLTTRCPGWLRPNKDGRFDIIEARAKVIRRIYDLASKGTGQHAIAATLNKEKVPTFSTAEYWGRSYIAKLLSNPAVIGTLVPHTVHYSGGKRVRRAEAGVLDYYPALIKRGLFDKVQALRTEAGAAQRGRHANAPLGNIFAGLARCPKCGDALTVANKGSGWRYLTCTKARSKAGCTGVSVRYDDAEAGLMLVAERLLSEAPSNDQLAQRAQDEADRLQAEMDEWAEEIGRLVDEAGAGTKSPPGAIAQRIAVLEEELSERRERHRALLMQAESRSSRIITSRVQALRGLLKASKVDKGAINNALRLLVSGIEINPEAGTIGFQWRQADLQTDAVFRMTPHGPAKGAGRRK
ncbi:MAG: recombinase family protein [Rhodospirillaceae bacterium]|nr:recombinase family protein [Rhodospirillaceae bacterium]